MAMQAASCHGRPSGSAAGFVARRDEKVSSG
jgi:hypothetical protein